MHLINNPFYRRSLEECDPALWSPNDVEALVVPGPASYHSRGHVPVFTDPFPVECCMEELQDMDPENGESTIILWIQDLIEYPMRYAGIDRQISVDNVGSDEIEINGESYNIPYHLGCTVNGLPIFHLTDSYARYQERRELIPDLDYVAQDEVSTDAFDVAALIAQAGNQKEWSAGPDGIYKAHVLYPTSTYKKLVLLTGWVSSNTVTALKEGHEKLEPLTLSREIIDVPCDPHCDWNEIVLFQTIAGLVDEGAKLSLTNL